jgi:hypothetical protein
VGLRVDERTTNPRACLDCGLSFPYITGFLSGPHGPRAVYFASTHSHSGGVAFIDVTLGTWGVESPADDHVTFSCELRVAGAVAVDAPVSLTDAPSILGRMLRRDEALEHALVTDFWEAVDVIGEQDPAIHEEVYGETHRWPFPDRPEMGVFVTQRVFEQGMAVLWVVHEKDGDWLFGNGDDFDPQTASLLHLSHIVADHPDVAEVADLPLGWSAERAGLGAPWLRQEYVPQDDDE